MRGHAGKWFTLVMLSVVVAMVTGCVYRVTLTPPKGATKHFLKYPDYTSECISSYDLTRLNEGNGRGLLIFTYEIYSTQDPDNLDSEKTKTGIRVWEKKFKAEDGDTLIDYRRIETNRKTTTGPIQQTESLYNELATTYIRGRIVYGGHLRTGGMSEATGNYPLNNNLYDYFLDCQQDLLKDQAIDTILIRFRYF